MKKVIFLLIFCFIPYATQSQTRLIDTTNFSDKFYHKKSIFEALPNKGGEIIFLGNSITEQGPWDELFGNNNIINRGIGGDTSDGILFRLDEIIESKPSKIFLLIGTNDLRFNKPTSYIRDRIFEIITKIKQKTPLTEIYLQNILPTLNRNERPIDSIKILNQKLMIVAQNTEIEFIDLFEEFADKSNSEQLYKKYSRDGLHLNGSGYLKWKKIISKYIAYKPETYLKRNLIRLNSKTNPYVFVVAHRGDWRNYPENSIGSLEGAIKKKVDAVEIDIQMSKDGKLIVFHDKTLDRTTNGKGNVSDYTYEEVQNFRLKDLFLTSYQIPSFEEYLKLAKGRIILDLDIKDDDIPFEKIGFLINKYDMFNQIIVRSYRDYHSAKKYYGKYLEKLIYFPSINSKTKNPHLFIEQYEKKINPIAYVVSFSEFNNEIQQTFKNISENNDKIWVHSITDSRSGGHSDSNGVNNTSDSYGWLINQKIQFIQTDRPSLLINYLKENNLHE